MADDGHLADTVPLANRTSTSITEPRNSVRVTEPAAPRPDRTAEPDGSVDANALPFSDDGHSCSGRQHNRTGPATGGAVAASDAGTSPNTHRTNRVAPSPPSSPPMGTSPSWT